MKADTPPNKFLNITEYSYQCLPLCVLPVVLVEDAVDDEGGRQQNSEHAIYP